MDKNPVPVGARYLDGTDIARSAIHIMKSIPVSLVALLAFCGSIYGGPEPSYSKDAPPPAPAAMNWTGFYVGVFGGYNHGHVEPDLTLGGSFNQIGPLKNALESRGSEDFNYDGGEAGGLIGYNYQLGKLMVGLESATSYQWARESTDTGAFILGQGAPPLSVRTSFKTHYLTTVAPRLGFACGRFMPLRHRRSCNRRRRFLANASRPGRPGHTPG